MRFEIQSNKFPSKDDAFFEVVFETAQFLNVLKKEDDVIVIGDYIDTIENDTIKRTIVAHTFGYSAGNFFQIKKETITTTANSICQSRLREDERKQTLLREAYSKAKNRTSFGSDYYRIDPKPIQRDNGTTLHVEWLQASYWTVDVLINWQSDRLKASELSTDELIQLLDIM